MKGKIVVIGGPTAIGKSDFAVDIALAFGGEVVGADSMQVYRGMDIGTGKVTEAEKRGVPHHMIDVADPSERYTVGRYLEQATAAIDDILSRGKLPVVVGGTGLYLNALLCGLNLPGADGAEEVRAKWKKILAERGGDYVYARLKEADYRSAEKISPSDSKRVIRALEIYEVTGVPKSEAATCGECRYDYKFIVLDCPREMLYERINARVDKMFAAGLESEARVLAAYRDCGSMQALGYKQIFEAMDGRYASKEELMESVKRLTRNYAKRQLTFLRGIKAEKSVYDITERAAATEEIARFLQAR